MSERTTGRNLVVCSDGTGNEGGTEAESNVFKLYRLLSDKDSEHAYYDQGLGTEKLPLLGKAFGVGISKNIQDGYRSLAEEYRPGDSIYLFGFSRGAFTARSLGGMISSCGLLRRKYGVLTKQAFELYRDARKHPEVAARFKRKFSWRTNVKFIGVWDTVGALGLPFETLDKLNPFRHRFHNTVLSPEVRFAYHALAVDDERRTFHPTLWTETPVEGQILEQVWFPGMHSDVGGGYENHDLSDISLEWMIQKAIDAGLTFIDGWEYSLDPKPKGKIHDSRDKWGKLFRWKVRDITSFNEAYEIRESLVHESVEQRRAAPECGYEPSNLPAEYTVMASRVPEELS